MANTATRKAIEAVWRIESARLIGGLVRVVRDVGLAEDLAQDALVTALERWPESGIPDNPGAWLMATAKNRAIDQLRRARMRGAQARRAASRRRRSARRRRVPMSKRRSTTTSATICCAWSSSPAIPCSRPRRAWR